MRFRSPDQWRRKAIVRFYLEEPVWWLERYRTFAKSCARWTVAAVLFAGAGLRVPVLLDYGDYWVLVFAGFCALGLIISLPLVCFYFGAMVTWLPFWWLISAVSRWQCSAILRTRGWPRIVLSPRLVRFPASIWRRLPDYEQILSTGWCDEWWEGEIAPVNLYATLALLEELDLEWRGGHDGRKTARERIIEAVGKRPSIS